MKSPLPGQVPPLNRLDNQSLHSELEQNLALDPRQTKHTPGMCVCVGGGCGGTLPEATLAFREAFSLRESSEAAATGP